MHLPLLVLFLAAQDPAPATEYRLDLRTLELLSRANREDFDPRRPLEEPYLNALEFDFGTYDFTLDDDEGDVEALWLELLPALTEQFLGEPVDVTTAGHELVVTGDSRARNAARRALEVVERWLGRAWTVELAELPCGVLDSIKGPVLDASEADALLAAHPPSVSIQRRATTRRIARFRRERLMPFLSDYDIEVSMGGLGATDPQVFIARWGSDAVVWLTPHIDGRVLVSCIWRAGEPIGAHRPARIYGPDHPPIDLAQGTGSRRVGSAYLTDGGAFVLADGGDEHREHGLTHGPILVRVRAAAGNGPSVDDVVFLGLGAGDRARPWTPPAHLNEPPPSGWDPDELDSLDAVGRDEGEAETTIQTATIDLAELIAEVRVAWEDAGLRASIERLGSEAVVAGPPEALALARRIIGDRLAPLARTFSVDLRMGTVAREAALGLSVGDSLDSAHSLLTGLVERRTGAAALGDVLDLTSARTWMYLQDVDMEHGNAIDLGDPLCAVVDAGTALRARVLPCVDGRFMLGIQLYQRDVSPPPFKTTVAPSLRRETADGLLTLSTEIECPVSVGFDVAEVLTVTPGAWTILAVETSDPKDGTVRVVVVQVAEALAAR